MHAVHVSTFTFPPRPTPDVEDLVRESITVRAYETACTVRILAPYDRVAPEIGARAGTLTPDGDAACILRAGADRGVRTLPDAGRWLRPLPRTVVLRR